MDTHELNIAQTRVLVVADDGAYVRALLSSLRDESFEVAVVATVADTLHRLAPRPDIVLLDAALSSTPARLLCTVIREAAQVRIVVFSTAGDGADMVEFLDAGADDYLPRADRVRELMARVRAVLRRRDRIDLAVADDVLAVGNVRLDAARHEVFVDGRSVHLPLKQFQLLELLLSNTGRVLTRGTLLERVWGESTTSDGSTLEVQIKRLREKVESEPADPKRIRTVRGIGYMFEGESRIERSLRPSTSSRADRSGG